MVDGFVGDTERFSDLDDAGHEPFWAANVDVAFPHVRDEVTQRILVDGGGQAVAGQLVQLAALALDQVGDLRAEGEVGPLRSSQDDGRPGAARQVFEQGADGGDADPGRDQDYLRAAPGQPGEGPVGSLDGDPGCLAAAGLARRNGRRRL
jgi:hypothetical protein